MCHAFPYTGHPGQHGRRHPPVPACFLANTYLHSHGPCTFPRRAPRPAWAPKPAITGVFYKNLLTPLRNLYLPLKGTQASMGADTRLCREPAFPGFALSAALRQLQAAEASELTAAIATGTGGFC